MTAVLYDSSLSDLSAQASAHHLPALDRILSAYKKVAQVLPYFETLSSTSMDRAGEQEVLAILYAIILDLHQRIHSFISRPGR